MQHHTETVFLKELESLKYEEFMIEDLLKLRHFFGLRPNRSCDSAPLCSYLFKFYYMVRYCRTEDALMLSYHGEKDDLYGFIPYCTVDKLDHYFKLQELYFNKVLNRPLIINSADEEGVLHLLESGSLDNYEVIRSDDLKDYIYNGDDLRTLAGRKYSKKRNHLNKFHALYDGRWEYRTLEYGDRSDIKGFLSSWMQNKLLSDQGKGINEDGEEFDPAEELDGEYKGICSLLDSPIAYEYMKIGGIYIDGKLSAFSLGADSEAESMAIIDVEKADESIVGLYQMINQQFLLHEFLDAEFVNREDDVGLEGLRQSKLSYFPCCYENKYILKQKSF